MTPRLRLGTFGSLLWIGLVITAYAIDGELNWGGLWIFGIFPTAFAWGVWWVVSGFRKAGGAARPIEPPPVSIEATAKPRGEGYETAAYLGGAWVLGLVTATAQGFEIGGAEWVGASMAPVLVGLVLGWVVRLFRKATQIPHVVFWWSFAALIVAGLSR